MPRLYKNLYVLTRWIGTAAQATGLAHDFSDSYAPRSLSYAARTLRLSSDAPYRKVRRDSFAPA